MLIWAGGAELRAIYDSDRGDAIPIIAYSDARVCDVIFEGE